MERIDLSNDARKSRRRHCRAVDMEIRCKDDADIWLSRGHSGSAK